MVSIFSAGQKPLEFFVILLYCSRWTIFLWSRVAACCKYLWCVQRLRMPLSLAPQGRSPPKLAVADPGKALWSWTGPGTGPPGTCFAWAWSGGYMSHVGDTSPPAPLPHPSRDPGRRRLSWVVKQTSMLRDMYWEFVNNLWDKSDLIWACHILHYDLSWCPHMYVNWLP